MSGDRGLAKRLGRTTLLSAEFIRQRGAGTVRLGAFSLDGFREQVPVFGLAAEAG